MWRAERDVSKKRSELRISMIKIHCKYVWRISKSYPGLYLRWKQKPSKTKIKTKADKKKCCPTNKIVSPIFREGDRKDTEQRVVRFVQYILSVFMEIAHWGSLICTINLYYFFK